MEGVKRNAPLSIALPQRHESAHEEADVTGAGGRPWYGTPGPPVGATVQTVAVAKYCHEGDWRDCVLARTITLSSTTSDAGACACNSVTRVSDYTNSNIMVCHCRLLSLNDDVCHGPVLRMTQSEPDDKPCSVHVIRSLSNYRCPFPSESTRTCKS